MLDNKGRKYVKEKKGEQPEELSNHYYNMEESELEGFNKNWDDLDKEYKFLENANKALERMPYK